MMTTFAALMGTLPIAVGWGAGAGSRRSLGLAVVGGLIFSQIITLYITPVYYVYIEGMRTRLSGRRRARVPAPAAAARTHEIPADAMALRKAESRGRA